MFVLHSETNGVFADGSVGHVVGWLALYVVAFYPAIVTSVLCYRRDENVGVWHSIVLGHSFVLMNYLSWACSWRALIRMLRRQNGWTKTDRTVESGPPAVRELAGTAV
jgi:hypothetical protein